MLAMTGEILLRAEVRRLSLVYITIQPIVSIQNTEAVAAALFLEAREVSAFGISSYLKA
jgi:hypothetical protein